MTVKEIHRQKRCYFLLLILITISSVASLIGVSSETDVGGFDYGEALSKSLLYFEAQRSGRLPYNQRVTWRDHSGLTDGLEQGVDLVGGYHDAGDHVKFGLPMAFTVTMLSWSVIEYGDSLASTGELSHALEAIKWGTDYFIKAHTSPNVLWAEVGDGDTDHYCWQRPEDMTTSRRAFKIDENNPGSDLAGETAAAMAAASIVFRTTNPHYSHLLLHHAQQLFEFGDKYRGKYDESLRVVKSYYASVSGYMDELLWGATWLYRATDNDHYMSYVVDMAHQLGGLSWAMSEFSWDVKFAGVQLLASMMIFKLHAVYGEWLLRDFRWDFVVDDLKGARLFLLNEDSTHAELVAMAQEDYNLDMRSVTVEISYSLPAEMMMTPSSPPIHVTSDRQVRNLLEILKTHRVCLCVSSRSKVETVSEKREEAGDNDEAGEWEEDVGDNDEAGEWEEDVGDNDEADECFEDVGDNESVEDENQDGEEENGEEENGEEDADNTIVGETDQNGGDYSLYGKVLDEDEEDDDNICFEEIEKTYAKTNAIEGGKSDCTSIYVNQSFVSKDALLSELRLTAVRGRFSFRIYKSTKTLLVAICRVSGCGWKIRASVKHGSNTFWVTKYVEKHLCSIGDRIAQRRHCTPKYVGSLFIDRVGIIDGITPQHITDAMKNMFGMTLDYTTSYRALLYAQKLVRGSAEEGYSRLPSYLEQISIANPDSITAIELDSEKRFKYLFLSFGASIKGFKYQRRVIVVDGTHLSGKYGGVMLVAAAQDGNFQIFPLAFGIVDAEDEPSWEWFFTKLASCISHDKPLVIVSDRHAAIKSACEKVFPWATRGICYYHLQDNIVKKFKGKHLMYLVKGAAYAHTVHDFNRYMAEIRSANPELATYLEKADAKLWSRVYCKGNRFNIKTSNIAESINSALKRARGFPIPFLLEFIRQKLGKWYWKRRQDALSLPTVHSRGVEYLLAVRSEIADTMTVEPIDGWRFFVKGGKMDCAVDLEHVKCGCGVYGVEKIPCSHAIAAGTHAGVHIDTLVCPLYSKNHLYAGYSENIYPIVSQHIEERECFPPNVKRGPGRQKKSRWQSWLELSRMRGHKPRKKHRARRCSNCKETGHTKPQCTQPVD